jgi:hypothetical protein
MNHLVEECKFVRVMNAVAAGTSVQSSTALDTRGYDGIAWVTLFGALTATQVTSLQAQSGAASNGSDATDITGAATAALADADGNKALILDMQLSGNPRNKPYVRCQVKRATANAVIDGMIAILYKGRKCPISLDATIKEAVKFVGG